MKPAPQPEGAGRGQHPAGTPSPRRRTASATGTDGDLPDLPDLVGFNDDELRVLASVAALGPALSPSPSARERMRARVLAGAGSGTVERSVDPAGDTADEVDELAARRRGAHGVRGRFLVAAAAALCLVVALSGTSLVLSRDALPGDALYSLKRASENTQLELTFGDTDRGLRHLDHAARRVDELGALVERESGTALGTGGGQISLVALEQVDPAIVGGLLEDLDSEAAQGSGLLTAAGVAGDPDALGSLSTWAQGQSARLSALRPQLPASEQPRLDSPLARLEQVRGRAGALDARLGCSPITTGQVDDLGPLPADVPCAGTDDPVVAGTEATGQVSTQPAPAAPTTDPVAPLSGGQGSGSGGSGSGGPGGSGPGGPGGSSGSGSGGTGGTGGSGSVATTGPPVVTPGAPLPTGGVTTPAVPLPTGLPTLSVPLPLPLLPPVTIGPIVPELPPITIGG